MFNNKKLLKMIFDKYKLQNKINKYTEDHIDKGTIIIGDKKIIEVLLSKFDLLKVNILGIISFGLKDKNFLILDYSDLIKYKDVNILVFDYNFELTSSKVDNYTKGLNKITLIPNLLSDSVFFKCYLEQINFKKHLHKLSKKLKNKKIILYGTGLFFKTIIDEYDLSNLNIVAICDLKYSQNKELYVNEYFQYPKISPDQIKEYNPYAVLTTVLNPIRIIKSLETSTLKDTKIKVDVLYNKPILELIKEVWNAS